MDETVTFIHLTHKRRRFELHYYNFVGNNFISGKHIEKFIEFKNRTVEERLSNLMKLQHVLEMVAVLEKYLDLPIDTASLAAR